MKEITIGDIQSRICCSVVIIQADQLTKKLKELYPTISITESPTHTDNEISIGRCRNRSDVENICKQLDRNNYDSSLLLDVPVIRIFAAGEEEILLEIE